MKTISDRRTAVSIFLLFGFLAGSFFAHTPTPTPQAANTASETTPSAGTETKTEPTPGRHITDEFPNYHPLVVHFPIVLLIIAALFQILSFFLYGKEFSMATLILLFVGAVSVWLASNTFHAHPAGMPEDVRRLYEEHELLANYTWWLALAALASKAVSHFFLDRKWWSEAVVLVLLVGASITVSIAGHHGAQLVHIKGVGPQGQYLEMEGH